MTEELNKTITEVTLTYYPKYALVPNGKTIKGVALDGTIVFRYSDTDILNNDDPNGYIFILNDITTLEAEQAKISTPTIQEV